MALPCNVSPFLCQQWFSHACQMHWWENPMFSAGGMRFQLTEWQSTWASGCPCTLLYSRHTRPPGGGGVCAVLQWLRENLCDSSSVIYFATGTADTIQSYLMSGFPNRPVPLTALSTSVFTYCPQLWVSPADHQKFACFFFFVLPQPQENLKTSP